MNVLSLFDGMSCGRIALERAGIKVDNYYSSEIDKYAIQVSDKNYPQDTKNRLGNVIDLTDEQLKEMEIDILIGGSPCQGFSMSGKMKGSSTKCGKDIVSLEQYLTLKKMGFEFEGQSYLFWEFKRIHNIVKPKYFFLENVRITKHWLPMFNEAMKCEPYKINSNLLSAQNRERFYWTNIPNVTIPEDKNIMFCDIAENLEFRELKPFMFGYYGDKKRIDKTKTIKAKKANCCTTSKTHPNQYYLNEDRTKMRNISISEYEKLQTLPIDYTSGVIESARYKMVGNGWTVDIAAHIFKGIV